MGRIYLALAGAALFLSCQSASAQICKPVAERTGEVGCWIIASQPVGQLANAETPQGKQIGRAGGPPVIVPGGPPMHLTATGTEQRRALVLILHDSSKHATTPEHDWVPKGLCKI